MTDEFWILDFGFWISPAQNWVFGTGCVFQSKIQNQQPKILLEIRSSFVISVRREAAAYE